MARAGGSSGGPRTPRTGGSTRRARATTARAAAKERQASAGGPLRTRQTWDRSDLIVSVLEETYAHRIAQRPGEIRRRFRRMGQDPFAFYRGAAPLFYTDVVGMDDPWASDKQAQHVWVHGDLHAENFGTYMDGRGVLVFDVNDFDEAYPGHFTWDVLRCAASLALLGWRKAFPDDVILDHVERYTRAYLDQVHFYVDEDDDHVWSLRLDTARGPVLDTLHVARGARRYRLLDRATVLEGQHRVFREGGGFRRIDGDEREAVLAAYERYLETIPENKRTSRDIAYTVKDVCARTGFGIGSAGLQSYSFIIEGTDQALENDVLLAMKEGSSTAISHVWRDAEVEGLFEHDGHRTALSQRALQAHADPYLGWTEIGGEGFVVREIQPYEADLDWSDLTEPDEVADLVEDLGRATAKVHCVSDADAAQDVSLVQGQVEDLIAVSVQDGDALVAWVQDFAMDYAARVRDDHRLFVDAFRAGAFVDVTST